MELSVVHQPAANTETPSHNDVQRAVARVSSEYLLRVLRLLSDLQNGELLTVIIGLAIVAANTAHLIDAADPAARYAGRQELPPDEVRRPVSVLALAGSLGLPFETTRRHVNKLVAAGRCRRVKGGVIVPASFLDNPPFLAAAETNVGYVLHFIRCLRRVGLDID
jgi:hypothetical protein